ncbi:MAG TPA: single-stranded-DNA-specific exonuclease RecJ [Clostridia bacterium]|nr:single-stranded-DNA-specific exonuclease RecJ [Clostridia bacterium]
MIGDKARRDMLNWLLPAPWELLDKKPATKPESDVLSRILEARGLNTRDKQDAFLNLSLDDLPDPFLFIDMERACDLIERTLERQRPQLLIFGDYDADGLTSTALLSRYFEERGCKPVHLIPDRFDDGYGLSMALVDEIALHHPHLVITVDTGTSSLDAVTELVARGISVIVTDHHLATGLVDRQKAPVINPSLTDDTFPFAHLSGAGVALMLTLGLDQRRGAMSKIRESLLVLSAVGTVADVMPLTGPNRAIVSEGLRVFSSSAPAGLKALCVHAESDADPVVRASDIAYSIAPRLNAAGRMSDVRLALDLLLEDDPGRASSLAKELNTLNLERRRVEQEIFQEAYQAVLEKHGDEPFYIAIAQGENWHPGVLGIVSSRLVDRFRMPAITLNEQEGMYTGSARSFGEIDLIEAIASAGYLLERYGGHKGAAGLTLKAEHLESFCQQMEGYLEAVPDHERVSPYRADTMLRGDELSEDLVDQFEVLEPAGHGFELPVVWIPDLVIETLSRVGNGRHLKIKLRTSEKSTRPVDAIFFNRGDDKKFYAAGDVVDVLATPELNTWGGRRQLQLNGKDMRPSKQASRDEAAALAIRSWIEATPQALISSTSSSPATTMSQDLFAALWQLMEKLSGFANRTVSFRPSRLAWLVSHSYNVKADSLEVLLALAVFDQVGLGKFSADEDSQFSFKILDYEGQRPALSQAPLWTRLIGQGVLQI